MVRAGAQDTWEQDEKPDFSLSGQRHTGAFHCYLHLMGEYKGDAEQSFSRGKERGGQRQQTQVVTNKTPIKYQDNLFYYNGYQVLDPKNLWILHLWSCSKLNQTLLNAFIYLGLLQVFIPTSICKYYTSTLVSPRLLSLSLRFFFAVKSFQMTLIPVTIIFFLHFYARNQLEGMRGCTTLIGFNSFCELDDFSKSEAGHFSAAGCHIQHLCMWYLR